MISQQGRGKNAKQAWNRLCCVFIPAPSIQSMSIMSVRSHGSLLCWALCIDYVFLITGNILWCGETINNGTHMEIACEYIIDLLLDRV